MADNHININSSTRLGFALRNAVDGLAKQMAQIRQLQKVMVEQNAGTDWSVTEVRFGLDTGKGVVAKNLITDAIAEWDADPKTQSLLTYFEGVVA